MLFQVPLDLKNLKIKARLHYGKNSAKLVGFKENKYFYS